MTFKSHGLLFEDDGSLITSSSGSGGGGSVTVKGTNGVADTYDGTSDDIPSSAVGLLSQSLNWHWSVDLATWARDYGSGYTNIPNTVSTPFTGARLYALNGSNAVPVNADANGDIQTTQAPAAPTDRSGTIATGATAQQLMAANADRKGFWIQNVDDGDLWINELGTATTDQPSLKLAPGALYEAPTNGVVTSAISIIGATTGQAFTAREW